MAKERNDMLFRTGCYFVVTQKLHCLSVTSTKVGDDSLALESIQPAATRGPKLLEEDKVWGRRKGFYWLAGVRGDLGYALLCDLISCW